MGGGSIVRLVGVSKAYLMPSGRPFWALRDVNLEVYRGDFVAVMGPSGHGKTTLLNMIGLLDRPTRGKVIIDGVDTSGLSDRRLSELRNRKVGFVFQQFNLINRMSVMENVEIPLVARGVPRGERARLVRRAIRMVGGSESWLDKRPTQLSGGEQQRVAIARAIVGDPDIILADEPTGNLDTSSAKVVMSTFLKLNRMGKTIVMVTHAPEIANCARKILFIRDGRIIGEEEADPDRSILKLY